MDILWKGLLGGLVTALIIWASRRGDILPGILPLAPVFGIIALLAVGSKGDPASLRVTALAGMKTLPAYLTFLGACWFLADKADYRLVILGGLAAWLAVVLVMFFGPRFL